MKYKEMTYREYKERFYGLNRLKFSWQCYETSYGSIVPVKFAVECLYHRMNDATYIGITPLGYLNLFGPGDDENVIVVKVDGKRLELRKEDLEEYRPFFEELRNAYETKIRERRDEES